MNPKKITDIIIEEISFDNSSDSKKILTGFSQLDSQYSGILFGDLVVIGGDTGMGKTQFAIDLALKISKSFPILYLSLKETKPAVVSRVLSSFSGISTEKISSNQISNKENEFLSTFSKFGSKLYVKEEFLNIETLSKDIDEFDFKVVFIDDVQILPSQFSKNKLNVLMHEFKALANCKNIAIVLLSQLSNDIFKKNPLGKPTLKHLDINNAIREVPDKIWFLYRPEYYFIDEDLDSDRSPTKNLLKLIIAKNRNGETGICDFEKSSNFSSFKERNKDVFQFELNYSDFLNSGKKLGLEYDDIEVPF